MWNTRSCYEWIICVYVVDGVDQIKLDYSYNLVTNDDFI